MATGARVIISVGLITQKKVTYHRLLVTFCKSNTVENNLLHYSLIYFRVATQGLQCKP